MDENQKPEAIRKLLETDGWKIIDKWLSDRDTDITNAIKKDLINLKWSEKDKWFAYYSGEANIIQALRKYIELETKREERQQKIQDFKDKANKVLDDIKKSY